MAITTTQSLPAPVQRNFSRKLLVTPTPNLIFNIPAMKKTRTSKSGDTEVFRRYNKLDPATVPLGPSGQVPPSQQLSNYDIPVQMGFYGTYLEIHEQVTLNNQDPVLNGATERLGVNLRETEDLLIRDALSAGGTVYDCTQGGGADRPTPISVADIRDVTRKLLSADAQMYTSGIEGEDREGTAPVRSSFFALGHTDLSKALDGLGSSFISKWNYPNQSKTLESEWGVVGNVRFLLSSQGQVDRGASLDLQQDVYTTYIVGKESYATIDQDDYTTRFIYRSPAYSNALELYSTVGWKMAFASQVLNDEWVFKMRCTL